MHSFRTATVADLSLTDFLLRGVDLTDVDERRSSSSLPEKRCLDASLVLPNLDPWRDKAQLPRGVVPLELGAVPVLSELGLLAASLRLRLVELLCSVEMLDGRLLRPRLGDCNPVPGARSASHSLSSSWKRWVMGTS
jgi:hypothetical protein